jgi:hypothetical protein
MVVQSDYFAYLCIVNKSRELLFYKHYFNEFYSAQTNKVKKKILWTLRVIEELERIPEVYFKHLEGAAGLYEIRVQSGSDIFRIFERGERIKREYYEEKKRNKSE